ncbi:MAG TPA: hypothetical protein VF902_04745 [Coriobacteriia bacterium]
MNGSSIVRHAVRRIACVVSCAAVLAALGAPAVASALTALPEYVCYLEAGTLYHALPHGSEGRAILAPESIPGGSAGLDPPIAIVAYSWAADGASIGILAQGTASGLYREFVCDQQGKDLKAITEPSAARPTTFASGAAVDPPLDAAANWPDGADGGATIRPDGDPPVPQVFLSSKGDPPVRLGPDEVRGRACSRVSISPGKRYVVYDVEKPGGGSEVWVTSADTRRDYFLATANGSRGAWQPYYRPGKAGGSGTGTTGLGRGLCPAPLGVIGLAGLGGAAGAGRRRRRQAR